MVGAEASSSYSSLVLPEVHESQDLCVDIDKSAIEYIDYDVDSYQSSSLDFGQYWLWPEEITTDTVFYQSDSYVLEDVLQKDLCETYLCDRPVTDINLSLPMS